MRAKAEETVPRNNLKYTRVSKLSMMPEGIETCWTKRIWKTCSPFSRSISADGCEREADSGRAARFEA